MVCVDNNCDTYTSVVCENCGHNQTIFYNRQDMVDWLSGSGNIQDILHYLSSDERELLLSGMCGKCFEEIFKPLDNEE